MSITERLKITKERQMCLPSHGHGGCFDTIYIHVRVPDWVTAKMVADLNDHVNPHVHQNRRIHLHPLPMPDDKFDFYGYCTTQLTLDLLSLWQSGGTEFADMTLYEFAVKLGAVK